MAATSAVLSGVGAGVQLYGALEEADAKKQQAEFQASQDRFNADISDIQAKDAIERGDVDANNLLNQARGVKGAQRAAAASSGVDVNSGSAAALVADTDQLSKFDVETIKSNAVREAFGYKAQAVQLRREAKMTVDAGERSARNTILTGGANALSSAGSIYSSFKKGNEKTSVPGGKGAKTG